jgi:hypothetical protein
MTTDWLVLLAAAAGLMLSAGVALGWVVRGRASSWCRVCGDSLGCAACAGAVSTRRRRPDRSRVDVGLGVVGSSLWR